MCMDREYIFYCNYQIRNDENQSCINLKLKLKLHFARNKINRSSLIRIILSIYMIRKNC